MKQFCANFNCDGDFPIVAGGHMHPGSTIAPIATQDEAYEAGFNTGLGAVLSLRCNEHRAVPQLNTKEFSGGECGACVRDEAYEAGRKDGLTANVSDEMRTNLK